MSAPKEVHMKAGLLGVAVTVLGGSRGVIGVLDLKPAPTPKGRYALARSATAVDTALKQYFKQRDDEVKKCATAAGHPDPVKVKLDTGEEQEQYDLGAGLNKVTPEFLKILEDLNDELITLPGTRQITHAELGECPITVAQEKMLLESGLLEDREPE